jgi:Sec-independent protein translocase protein TatA
MISGLGFTEIIVIGLIIIMFFGSEDLPKLLRMVGEQWGKIRRFTNAARAEIDTVVKDVTPDLKNEQESSIQIKNRISENILKIRSVKCLRMILKKSLLR